MQALWLRYLTKIDDETREAPTELLENQQVNKALAALQESAFTDAQLLGYEKFWDVISTEKTHYNSAMRRGLAEGKAKGLAEGRNKEKQIIARSLKFRGMQSIADITGLSMNQINTL